MPLPANYRLNAVSWRSRFMDQGLLVAFLFLLLVFAATLAFWYVPKAITDSRRLTTKRKFKAVALALRAYNDTYGHLPYSNATNYPFSWRYELLGYFDRRNSEPRRLPKNETWNSRSNTVLWENSDQPFCYATRAPSDANNTCLLALTGPSTAFGDGRAKPNSLHDLACDTILVIESRNAPFAWPQPGDADIRELRAEDLSSIHAHGFHVAFADGAVWFLQNDVPFDKLALFFTTQGALENDRDNLLGAYRYDP